MSGQSIEKEQISSFVTAVTANLQPLSHCWSFSQWHCSECWEPPRRGSTTYTQHIRPDGNFLYKWKLQQQNIDFSVKKKQQFREYKENLKKEKKNPLNSKVYHGYFPQNGSVLLRQKPYCRWFLLMSMQRRRLSLLTDPSLAENGVLEV